MNRNARNKFNQGFCIKKLFSFLNDVTYVHGLTDWIRMGES